MKVINSFAQLSKIQENIVVALGTFDGLHCGHLAVINNMLDKAHETGCKSMVITFDRHPKAIVDPSRIPAKLMTADDQITRFSSLDIDYLFIIEGTKEFFDISAEEFIANLLASNINNIFVGENFTFGKYAKGNAQMLKDITAAKNVQANIVELSYIDEAKTKPISSTLIRQAIKDGDVELANKLLGYHYGFIETVVLGDQRGRTLGFPTANFIIDKSLACPKDGVYVNRVCIDGNWYNGVGNVGDNPTFDNQTHRVEIHIFDFDEDIYGKEVKVEFLKEIRDEVKFNSLDALISQMEKDKRTACEYLRQNGYMK